MDIDFITFIKHLNSLSEQVSLKLSSDEIKIYGNRMGKLKGRNLNKKWDKRPQK